MELKALNGKEIKKVLAMVEEQWGAKLKLDYAFLQSAKNRIFLINREISRIDISKLRINAMGMYFCEIADKGIRLSIEGSQIVGPSASKNVLVLNDHEAKLWLKGEDLEKEGIGLKGFVLIKHNGDFLGSAKVVTGKILNFVGKTRRINAI